MNKLWNWFLYITNNEETSKHEQQFDIVFFIINTLALIAGIFMFATHNASEWIPVLIIEYTWAFYNLRNNRG